ncbi:hypothetical protein FRC14_002782 [Serendipita sp. 396]|nr:hypothetical protein FRC14_002782 [Serendipita sp. 396]KAG8788734.1 hypothetical protein FRC15_002492 [Serendipita sp. 397]KAG8839015.1 hypothetical protein FRC18_001385 [Serendipita sp. 400]KAG8860605.1 hypothetical protein FRB91_002492 [Serendipita sp. 411]KAG8875115.1 hypothetical protein FRC20_004440 [Serendipita sp. 405]
MDESLHAHLRLPILKILHSQGITKASATSLHVLSSVLDKYLQSLLVSCQEYANHAGRCSLHVYDVLGSLEEMGTVLDDLKDYAETEGSLLAVESVDKTTGIPGIGLTGQQRYANMAGTRKDIELNEFKDSLYIGLTAPEDRISQHLTLTRLPTPDPSELNDDSLEKEPSSHEGQEDAMVVDKPFIQLPLSPISNSPPNSRDMALPLEANIYSSEDSCVPSFLPPFPTTLMDQELDSGDPDRERMEEQRREEEMRKQSEADNAEKERQSDELPTVTQSFPANYIVPAPYEASKLQARGAWHLPSLSKLTTSGEGSHPVEDGAFSAEAMPYVRGVSTNDELLAALSSLSSATETKDTNAPKTSPSQTISTNPLRHKVSLIFLGTTPARFNTPDTLFGLSATLSPTPRPGNPLPTYVDALDPQPGIKTDGKSAAKAKGKDGDLPLPPTQGRSVGLAPNPINPVSGIGSRIPLVGRALLAKPTLTRAKRLGPPPIQKRDDKTILYHSPNPPIPAHWNNAVSGSNAALGNVSVEPGKGRAERNPFGVAEATLGYTWDWNVKNPKDGLDKVRASVAGVFAVTAPLAAASPSVDIGKASGVTGAPPKERTLPKLSLNVTGRKSSMLSTSTPVSTGGLIARLPGITERSHSSVGITGSMPPPPIPSNPLVVTLNRSHPSPEASDSMKMASPVVVKELTDTEPLIMDVDIKPDTSRWQPDDIDSQTTRMPKVEIDVDESTLLAAQSPPIDPDRPFLPVSKGSNDIDMDIDAALAEVIGEERKEQPIVDDIEADIVEALGPASPTNLKPLSPDILPLHREPESDGVLAALLLNESPINSIPNHHHPPSNFEFLSEPSTLSGSTSIVSGASHDSVNHMANVSLHHPSALPISTSALRSTTTPAPPRTTTHTPDSVPVTESLLDQVANERGLSAPVVYEHPPPLKHPHDDLAPTLEAPHEHLSS